MAARIKPARYADYLTVGELAVAVDKTTTWLKRLERQGRIPKPARVKRGQLEFRLYSPSQVEEIREILSQMRPGRPRKG